MNILLVDDDLDVIEGIMDGVDWEGLGFRQVYLAPSVLPWGRFRGVSGCAAAGPRLWPGTNAPAAPDASKWSLLFAVLCAKLIMK